MRSRSKLLLLAMAIASFSAAEAFSAGGSEPTAGAPIRNPEHQFARKVRSWQNIKQQNIVMQRRDYSCGAAALATIAKYYWGDNLSEDYFLDLLDKILTPEEATDRIENGLAMADLRKAAVKAGYQAAAGRLTFDGLSESKVPLIVGITIDGHDHFVVYRGTDWKYVYVADPIRGNIRILVPVFVDQWQENAVLVIHKPGQKVKEFSPLSVRWDEIQLGELNDQLIRTQSSPSRQPPGRQRSGIP
jgi:hypothetical protein